MSTELDDGQRGGKKPQSSVGKPKEKILAKRGIIRTGAIGADRVDWGKLH